ncbi:hypothetical protein U2G91_26745 (plasmid) [Rhodococcoides fascians]|uniref:hypothetical protein n=1 Tax=Rhodococcoides fascians TaxID=1828 RepID=UPI002ACDCC1C|nr:hypothetical protein [Rhodococcus fascians]WQH31161.1 hypothetical protein U2G91_26745 [Rhodococcus fascians]
MSLPVVWLVARRRAARVKTAAAVEQARKVLTEYAKSVRTAQITGSADDLRAAATARRHCQHQWLAIGNAMRALPKRERHLVEVWNHAAAMAWWHRDDDRQGWACFEAAAAQVIAALPGGVDSDAVAAVIEAGARRCEGTLQRRVGKDLDPLIPGGTKRIEQDRLVRLLRENLLEVVTDGSGTDRADMALRHFEPWLCESIVELSKPRSQDRLHEIADRWRALHAQFTPHWIGPSDPTLAP